MWVLNNEEFIRKAHAEGVRQIFTDRPDLAIRLQGEVSSASRVEEA